MDERKVRDAIALLEREVPRAGARVRIAQYGGGPDESQIVANEGGFLRLGIEFLKAAYAPVTGRNQPTAVDVELDYLLTPDSSIQFDWFERREPEEERRASPGRLVPGVIISAVVGTGILAVIGLIALLRWFVV